jgi:hypothetical protein
VFVQVTESGQLERNLVVTVGNYTVIWNFRRVKQSDHDCYTHEKGLKSCYCYKVVPKEESIVESRFMHEGQKRTSVLSTSTIRIVNKANLWSPQL